MITKMPKKVLHIINDLDSGGAERMLYNILKQFDDVAENHAVVSLHDKGLYGDRIEALGIELYQMNIEKVSKLRVFFELRKIIKNYDVIDTWLYQSDFLGAIINKTLLNKKKLIWNIRHANLDSAFNKKSTLKIVRINAKLSKSVSVITYNSNKAKYEHEKIGYSTNNVHILPNGFEIEKFEFSSRERIQVRQDLKLENEPTLVTVGRWNVQKDYPTLLAALKIVKKECSNFKMIMVGKDLESSNETLLSLIKEYNLEDNMLLLGVRRDIKNLLSASDIYISSSLGESFSNSIGEAMCSGLEIIATDVGDSRIIVGNTGMIVEAQNSEKLSKAILHSIENLDENRNQMAVTRVKEKYSIKNVSNLFLELYR